MSESRVVKEAFDEKRARRLLQAFWGLLEIWRGRWGRGRSAKSPLRWDDWGEGLKHSLELWTYSFLLEAEAWLEETWIWDHVRNDRLAVNEAYFNLLFFLDLGLPDWIPVQLLTWLCSVIDRFGLRLLHVGPEVLLCRNLFHLSIVSTSQLHSDSI